MQKPESEQKKSWDRILNKIQGLSHHENVENAVNNGTPDKSYCVDGVNGWIEFKVHTPKNTSKPLGRITHWNGMQREWMRQRYLSPAVFMILRMYDWDFILDTQNLFTFELKSYDELVREHNWKVKIPHNVTALQLEMLRWKLKGQCRGEFCKFNMLKG